MVVIMCLMSAMSEQNLDLLKNKVSEALNIVGTPRIDVIAENFKKTEVVQPSKPDNFTPSSVINIPTREELEVSEDEILEVVKPVLMKAADLATTTQNPDLAEKYNRVVDNAISTGWLAGNESNAIQARAEQVKKEKEEKTKAQLDKVEARVRSIEMRAGLSSVFELNGAKSELRQLDTNGLSDEVKNRIDLAIKKIDSKIETVLKQIKQKQNEELSSESGLLNLVFGEQEA